MRRVAPLAVLLLAAALALGASRPVTDDEVNAVAANLRCVVCQSLSVADSPSETANQMRGIIRQRLADGETPEQVVAYFVDKYGLWILLAPPRQGFNLLVWIAPFAGLAVGLLVIGAVIMRWRRRARLAPASPPAVDEAMRGRIAREMAELDR